MLTFTPLQLAVLDAIKPRTFQDDDAWICESEHAIGQGSTEEIAMESWLNNLGERLVVEINMARKARA